MSGDANVLDILPGTILPGRRQFIKRVFIESGGQEADIEIPGQVRRCAGEYDFAILPYAQIVQRGDGGTRAALVAAEVRDERGLDRAMVALRERRGDEPILGFAIRVQAKAAFGELLDAGERESGGCGCGGGSGPSSSVPARLSIGLLGERGAAWTAPVAGRLLIFPSLYSGDGSFVFDCHSVWFGWFDRSPACEGPCAGRLECRCDNAGEPRKRFNCFGEWRICVCK